MSKKVDLDKILINPDWESNAPSEEEVLKALNEIEKAKLNIRKKVYFGRYPYC